jgi:tRNA A37 threonylcarbamoyladenosine synthetase subunit TsaC/SUA5/YrdC
MHHRPDIAGDAQRALEVLQSGGVVMIPHACGYGMFGGTEESINRISSTKQRAGHKRNTMLCDMETQREVQVLDRRAQDMIEAIAVDYDLPLCTVAPYRTDHPLLKDLSSDLLKGSTANGTINLYCNAGFFPAELCKLARAANQVMFGSSANLTGTGQRFRVSDVQPEVRAIADLIIDYGLCRYHSYKRSATIINFTTLEVVRVGACYEQIADILKRHFDLEVPADPGLNDNPSGHLQEFALKDKHAN